MTVQLLKNEQKVLHSHTQAIIIAQAYSNMLLVVFQTIDVRQSFFIVPTMWMKNLVDILLLFAVAITISVGLIPTLKNE